MSYLAIVVAFQILASACRDTLWGAQDYLIRLPLYKMYRLGPNLNGWGFWENRTDADVCAALTGTSSAHWETAVSVCDDLITRKFEAYYIMATTILYVLFSLYLCHCALSVIHFRMSWAPIMREYRASQRQWFERMNRSTEKYQELPS